MEGSRYTAIAKTLRLHFNHKSGIRYQMDVWNNDLTKALHQTHVDNALQFAHG